MDINDSTLNHLQDLPQFDKWYSAVRNGKQIPSNWSSDIQKQNETHTNIEQCTLFIIIHAHGTMVNYKNLTKKGYLREQQKTLPFNRIILTSNIWAKKPLLSLTVALEGLTFRHDPYPPSPSHHGSGEKMIW